MRKVPIAKSSHGPVVSSVSTDDTFTCYECHCTVRWTMGHYFVHSRKGKICTNNYEKIAVAAARHALESYVFLFVVDCIICKKQSRVHTPNKRAYAVLLKENGLLQAIYIDDAKRPRVLVRIEDVLKALVSESCILQSAYDVCDNCHIFLKEDIV